MKLLFTCSTSLLLIFINYFSSGRVSVDENAREVGVVQWNRDLKKVVELAESKNKPIFLLFQEVPG